MGREVVRSGAVASWPPPQQTARLVVTAVLLVAAATAWASPQWAALLLDMAVLLAGAVAASPPRQLRVLVELGGGRLAMVLPVRRMLPALARVVACVAIFLARLLGDHTQVRLAVGRRPCRAVLEAPTWAGLSVAVAVRPLLRVDGPGQELAQ